jgi:hypothetical protein
MQILLIMSASASDGVRRGQGRNEIA